MNQSNELGLEKNNNAKDDCSGTSSQSDQSESKKRSLEDNIEIDQSKKTCNAQSNNQSVQETNNECKEKIPLIKAFVAERQGERDSMQDRHVIINDYHKYLKTLPSELKICSYFAVFDGHAGSRAATYCAENMHKIIADKISKTISNNTTNNCIEQIQKDIKRILMESFKQCDDEFLKIAAKNKPAWKDGTTATVILILNNTLYSANIGDTKAIIHGSKLINNQSKDFTIELTCEHNPSIYEERQRIQKNSGFVKDGRVLGVLEVSRSIGDGPYKAYGVSCIPDVRKCQLSSLYKYVILGCDGLWKSFSNDEAVKFINSIVDKESESNNKSLNEKQNNIYQICCSRISNDAVKKLTADNVTVVILSIKFES